MQYLPYAEEKTWQQQIYPEGYDGYYMKPQGQTTWPDEMPLTYDLGETFWGNVQNGNYWDAAGNILMLPATMIDDGIGMAVNSAANGYKRLYNNAAALYNNAAGLYNSWTTPTVQAPTQAVVQAPRQTSLTGRVYTPVYTKRLPTMPYSQQWALQPVASHPLQPASRAYQQQSYMGGY